MHLGGAAIRVAFLRQLASCRLLWASAPAHTVAALGLTACSAAVMTVGVIATGQLIGALRHALSESPTQAGNQVWLWLFLTAVTLVTAPVVGSATSLLSRIISTRFLRRFYDMVMDASTVPHGIGHLEDPRVVGRMDAVINATREWDFTAGLQDTLAGGG